MRLLAEVLQKSGFWLQLVLLGLLDWGTLTAFAAGDGGWPHIVGFAVVNVLLLYGMARIWGWLGRSPSPPHHLPQPAPTDLRPSGVDRRMPWLGVGAFAATCGLLALGAVHSPKSAEASLPSPTAELEDDGSYTLLVDASDRSRWVGLSLELGRPVPEGAAADLVLRRTSIRAPRGAATPEGDWVEDLPGGNPIFDRWYRFSPLDGGLVSQGKTYLVRLDDGTAHLRIEGYHCPDGSMGCLSLRWSLSDE